MLNKKNIINKIKKLIKMMDVHPNSAIFKNIFIIKIVNAITVRTNMHTIDVKKILTAIISEKSDKETRPCNKCLFNLSFVFPKYLDPLSQSNFS